MFETYFSLAEIAAHIPKSAAFWRAELKAGRFAPAVDGQADLSNVVSIGGEFFVPASGVAHYLEQHQLGPRPLADLMNGRPRQQAGPGRVVFVGRKARSPGELRRVIEAQSVEVANG